jgi:hypothetical protein
MKKRPAKGGALPSRAELDAMIEEATVDAHDVDEQRIGFHAVLEDEVRLPFDTEVLGVTVTVSRLEVADDGSIVAVCRRGASRQAIPILDLPMPDPRPAGAEWIEAYRRWARAT